KTDADLEALIEDQDSILSTFEFLRRTKFCVTDDFDRLEEKLHERLRQNVTNSDVAFNALWECIDKLGGREQYDTLTASTKHRITKKDLKNILKETGAILAPTISLSTARESFSKTSAIGRSWIRDIAGEKITNSV